MYRRRNKRLRNCFIVLMFHFYIFSCVALEKSNSPYKESILETCVSQNHKEILAMWVWLGRKLWKSAEAMQKSILELRADFFLFKCVRARVCVCVCVTEKKITALKLLQLFCNKCKSSIQKGFWKCRTTNQNILFFALDIDLKMTQKTKKKVASICVMHQKRWRKLKLIWIDYEQSIIEQLMNINIHERFSLLDRNVLAGFMISLFLAAHAPRGSSKNTNSIKPNGNISMKWPKALPFVWEKVLFKQKLKFFC